MADEFTKKKGNNFNKKMNGKKYGPKNKTCFESESRNRPLPCSQSNNIWTQYFPDNVTEGDLSVMLKIKAVEEFMLTFNVELLVEAFEKRYFIIDIWDITKNEFINKVWPQFVKDLEGIPNFVIGLFGFVCELICKQKNVPDLIRNGENETVDISYNKIIPRFIGVQKTLPFKDLKSYNYGKFITVIGIVIRVSDVKAYCIEIAFTCLKCQGIQIIIQDKGCYMFPNRCQTSDCHSRAFKPLRNSKYTQTIPRKSIYLQELSIDQSEGGRVPRSIECELTCDLADFCLPGDVVSISGIVKINTGTEKKNIVSKDLSHHLLYISANSVTCVKGKSSNGAKVNTDTLYFRPEDFEVIRLIHAEQNLFRLLVASLSPNIFGHELVKAGLILALFGGGSPSKEGKSRENSHVLVVGDPGLGKSQMLLAASSASPRGVYVCGNSTTASGLTVTISKKGGGENSLEAGALVLADQGHCCIDEFDKMMQQHSAMLEAMEQQTISIAKSGFVSTLPARTSIIAAANPSGGHYNKSKTVSENLKMNGALLSRFDLVFILRDRPDVAFDNRMSEHVMGLHTRTHSSSHFEKNSSLNDSLSSSYQLEKRLQKKRGEMLNCISHPLLQKYICYARKFCRPKLSPQVCDILRNFYLEMRRQQHYTVPITTRQLESLIRLTKARARVELRESCTTEDAEDVIEIMRYSMQDTFSDEFGNLDFDRSIHGSGMSRGSRAKKLINALTKAAVIKADNCFTVLEMKDIAKNIKIPIDSFDFLLESLNDKGFLLKKGFQLYKIETL